VDNFLFPHISIVGNACIGYNLNNIDYVEFHCRILEAYAKSWVSDALDRAMI
jgi:hypothetical protein